MKILFIYNPSSGNESGEKFIGKIEYNLKKYFDEVIIKRTEKENDATKFVGEVKDADAIGVYGGDGTINEVLLGMYKNNSSAKLLILPGGTGNILAKRLGIPRRIDNAIRCFDFKKTKKIDIGKANDKVFSLFASIGAVPEAIHEVSSDEKSRLGGLAYVKKSARKLASSEEYDLIVKSDDGNYFGEVDHLIVALISKVGKFEFTSINNSMNTGKANLVILTNSDLRYRMSVLKKSIEGDVKEIKDIKYFSVSEVDISSNKNEKICIDIDGDKGPDLPVNIRILKEAVEVYIPNKES